MSSIYKMPSKIKLKIQKKAPIVTSSENSGRRFGDFTDYDIDSRAYNNVLCYIQKGLSSYTELIKAILKPILQMQSGAAIKYSIITFTFGIDDEPFYQGKCFNIDYQPSISKISKILLELSGNHRSHNLAIIPRLFPESTVANSYSGGKTGIKRKEDLLIVIGKKGEVFFDELIREEVEKFKKQILFVEIENENVNWYFYDYKPRFKSIIIQGVNKMKRELESTKQTKLLKSDLWVKKIEKDCINQNVFFTIRDNRIDLYHKGGKLFSFDNEFKTHIKYAAVINKDKSDYLTELELSNPKYLLAADFIKDYKRINENCANYSGIEASGVSHLYHKYSYLSNSNIVVLDIEVSFKSQNNEKKQDRIDILLYDKKNRILQFVEAKHYTNSEIWSSKTPKVIKQIKRYESQIKDKQNIIKEYSNYIKIINNIFNISLQSPKDINPKVILLIFGFDRDQQRGKLKTLYKKNSAYSGIKFYSKGDIKSIVIENLWKAKVLK